MKNKCMIILVALVISLIITSLSVPVNAGEKLIKSTLMVEGKNIPLETIRPEGKLHVELRPIIRATGWSYNDRSSDVIYIKGKPFRYFVKYEGKIYANAAALGELLGYKVKLEEDGDLIHFFPKPGEATKGENSVEIEIRKKEKFPSEKKGYTLWKLELKFTNKTENPLVINTSSLIMLKADRNGYFSETAVNFSLKPDEEKKIDRLYFLVPDDEEIDVIGLTNSKRNALIGKCKW